MRIIAGTARGRRLASFSLPEVRPTSDRVREALFSILVSRLGSLDDCRVLDLFSGTGALGLEALSRGALRVLFVERHPRAVSLLRENLVGCRLADRAEIVQADVLRILPELGSRGDFDLIFADPPYGKELAEAALAGIARAGLLAGGGIACLETASNEKLPEHAGGLTRHLARRYGSTLIHLYGRQEDGKEAAPP